MKILILILASFSFIFFFNFEQVHAAQIYFEPHLTSYRVGDSFFLSLFLDAESDLVNAVEIKLATPKLLKIKNVSKGGSVIKLWINEPSFSEGIVNIAGGIPGGFSDSKGLIAKIYFEAVAVGEGNIALMPGSAILLNDGEGTRFDLKTSGGPLFNVVPRPKDEPSATLSEAESLSQEFNDDKEKPDKFEILFGKDPRVFGGESFISFFTTDRNSGVDHYEVKLGKEPFGIAQSPYLIKGIGSMAVIKVRAYDAAGNYREVTWPGTIKRIWWRLITLFYTLI